MKLTDSFDIVNIRNNCSVVHKSRAVRKTIITSLSTIPQFLIMSKESCVYDSKTDVNVYHTVTFLNSHDSSRWFINVKVEGFIYLSESLTISFKRRCIMTRLIYIYVDIHVCWLEVRVTQTVLSYFDAMMKCIWVLCSWIVDAYFSLMLFLRRYTFKFPKI